MTDRSRAMFLALVFIFFSHAHLSNGQEIIQFERAAIAIPTSLYGGFLIDRDGFIWIGTTGSGVFRYDGYELKSFSGSVEGLMIVSIVEDKDGVIWIASLSNGITSYDKETGLFTKYKHDPENANSLSSNNFAFLSQTLYVDESNRLWVGTDGGGLCVYDKTTSTWTRHTHDPGDSTSLSDNAVTAIAQGKDGALWVGTQRGGLNRFVPETGKWEQYTHNPDDPGSLSDNWICSILEDRDEILWIGTKKGGLNKLDKAASKFNHYTYDPNDAQSIGGDEVWSLHEDHSGGIWTSRLVSSSSGLDRFDKETGTFTRFAHDPSDPATVGSNAITRVFQDPRTKIIWVINHDGRIDKNDRNASRFRHWPGGLNHSQSLSGRLILPILQDNENIVWVGTMAGGLNRIDRITGNITRYSPNPHDPSSIPRARVTALHKDSAGDLWIGFWDGILARFDRDLGQCVRIYEHDPTDPLSITESERLKYILEDRDDPNILWLATVKGGLDKFDKSQESFTHYKHTLDNTNSLSHNSVITLYDDGKGMLLLSTYGGGLDIFDKKTETFTNYRNVAGNPQSLGSDTLYEVLETSDGELWVARKGGISHFNPESGNFKNYDKDEDGVPLGPVGCLLQDDEGNFWLGTAGTGLVRFDPRTGATKRFSVYDGLQGDTYFWTSRLKTTDGEMWFGGANGISSFYPTEIMENPHAPIVRLTALSQGGNPVNLGSSPERLREITLDWRNNYFEFQFAALNFTVPEKNQYAYRLEGWDEEWFDAGSNPHGTYSGLAGGRYTLKLKGSNNDGVWNEDGASITIIVNPPFWETTWFYCAIVGSGLIIVFAIGFEAIRLRKEIRNRKQAEKERAKLEKQLHHSQKLETIGTLSGGIAHDFNNILTPILGYADMGRRKVSQSHPVFAMLEQISKGAHRAKELVEQILLFSKQTEKERTPLHLPLLVQEAVSLLRPSIPTTIEIQQHIDTACHYVMADESQMHQVIVNLCTNAWQAMEDKGGTLMIGMKEVLVDDSMTRAHPHLNEGDHVCMTVTDTGIGMDSATLDRIFEPFFTTKPVDKGTGMGLSVVHGIVRSHHGDILVSSEPGKGSTFRVYIPIAQSEETAAKEEIESIRLGRESLMVVDDDMAIGELVKEMLEELGYTIEVHTNSQKALDAFDRQPDLYDLVISDLTMPGMTGLELSDQLKRIRSGIPIIIMTGYGNKLTPDTRKQYGITEVIGKPIVTPKLASTIRTVLDRRIRN